MPSRREVLGSLALAGTAGCLGDRDARFTAGSDTAADWPMPRYDPANTAFAPDAAAPRTDVTERWSAAPGFDVRTPAIVDGTVFVPAAEGLIALDGASGDEQWRFAPSEQPWPSPPTVHDGTAYVTMVDDDTLHAVDAETGDEQWALTEATAATIGPHLLAGDLVDDPLVLVGSENGVIRGLAPADGAERWRLDVFGGVRTMAYDSRGLYVGTRGGEVYAYALGGDGDMPRERWRRKLGSQIEAITPTDNGVVVSTFGGPLRNLQDGAHAGTTDWIANERHAGSPPVRAGSWVYSTGWKSLSSLRLYDKNLYWRVSGTFGDAGPVAAGDTLYVPGGNNVQAVALSGGIGVGATTLGAKRWTHPIESGGIQGLAIGDGALFVACESHGDTDSSLLCLEPA